MPDLDRTLSNKELQRELEEQSKKIRLIMQHLGLDYSIEPRLVKRGP